MRFAVSSLQVRETLTGTHSITRPPQRKHSPTTKDNCGCLPDATAEPMKSHRNSQHAWTRMCFLRLQLPEVPVGTSHSPATGRESRAHQVSQQQGGGFQIIYKEVVEGEPGKGSFRTTSQTTRLHMLQQQGVFIGSEKTTIEGRLHKRAVETEAFWPDEAEDGTSFQTQLSQSERRLSASRLCKAVGYGFLRHPSSDVPEARGHRHLFKILE